MVNKHHINLMIHLAERRKRPQTGFNCLLRQSADSSNNWKMNEGQSWSDHPPPPLPSDSPLTVFLTLIIHLSEVIMTAGPNAFTHRWDQADRIHNDCSDDWAGSSVTVRWACDGNTLPHLKWNSLCVLFKWVIEQIHQESERRCEQLCEAVIIQCALNNLSALTC